MQRAAGRRPGGRQPAPPAARRRSTNPPAPCTRPAGCRRAPVPAGGADEAFSGILACTSGAPQHHRSCQHQQKTVRGWVSGAHDRGCSGHLRHGNCQHQRETPATRWRDTVQLRKFLPCSIVSRFTKMVCMQSCRRDRRVDVFEPLLELPPLPPAWPPLQAAATSCKRKHDCILSL